MVPGAFKFRMWSRENPKRVEARPLDLWSDKACGPHSRNNKTTESFRSKSHTPLKSKKARDVCDALWGEDWEQDRAVGGSHAWNGLRPVTGGHLWRSHCISPSCDPEAWGRETEGSAWGRQGQAQRRLAERAAGPWGLWTPAWERARQGRSPPPPSGSRLSAWFYSRVQERALGEELGREGPEGSERRAESGPRRLSPKTQCSKASVVTLQRATSTAGRPVVVRAATCPRGACP